MSGDSPTLDPDIALRALAVVVGHARVVPRVGGVEVMPGEAYTAIDAEMTRLRAELARRARDPMSGDPTRDLDRLAAFFGDGVTWSLPDDEVWFGEDFVGSDVVARLRAELARAAMHRQRCQRYEAHLAERPLDEWPEYVAGLRSEVAELRAEVARLSGGKA